MSTSGVLYWHVGDKHAEHFVVSLMSLRRHWSGPVAVVTGDTYSADLTKRCHESELGPLHIVPFDYQAVKAKHRRHATYFSKCFMCDVSPFDRTAFIDLDTLVVGPIDEVFPKRDEVVLTQFADWWTNQRPINRRIESWRHVLPEDVAMMLANPYPAINTGVFGFSTGSVYFMREWQEVTAKNVVFIADELAAQLIFPRHLHLVLDDRFNWSPIHSREKPDIRIMHGHGRKFIKRDRGWKIWEPYYREAMARNIAGIRSWSPQMKEIKNRLADVYDRGVHAVDADDEDDA